MTDQTTKKPRRKFTYKMLRAIALSYDTREALKIGDRYAYQLMHKLGKADEYCAHMQPPGMSTKWTLENLQASILSVGISGVATAQPTLPQSGEV